eukprot:1184839-Prorocentrum_minimum.AAC.7
MIYIRYILAQIFDVRARRWSHARTETRLTFQPGYDMSGAYSYQRAATGPAAGYIPIEGPRLVLTEGYIWLVCGCSTACNRRRCTTTERVTDTRVVSCVNSSKRGCS